MMMAPTTSWRMGSIPHSAVWQRANGPLWGAAPTTEHSAMASRPVPGREPSQTWGLDSGWIQIHWEEQLDTDRDSLLLLRQMVITALAPQARGPERFHSFLEHPRDPVECSRAPAAKQCSSIWVTEVYQQRAQGVNHKKIHLDQCRLGQVVQQSTTLSTDLPLHHWQGLECNHGGHTKPKEMTSRYPPSLMAGLSDVIIKSLPEEEAPSQGHQSAREPPGRTDRITLPSYDTVG